MKTKQELLDFYGVEIGKKYQITSTDLKFSETNIFTVVETPVNYGGLALKFLGNSGVSSALTLLSECCYEEVKPPILDDVEREYLQHYVMDNPAFKGKVLLISKQDYGNNECYIQIQGKSESIVDMYYYCTLPVFKINDMYKGMELDKDYTPKELGLEE